MFWGQIVGTVVAGTVQLGVQAWMFTNIEDMCDPHQKDGFICPGTEVFGTASIIVSFSLSFPPTRFGQGLASHSQNSNFSHGQWGAIGPALQFSKGQIY